MLKSRLSLLDLKKSARMRRYANTENLQNILFIFLKICVAPPIAAAYGFEGPPAAAECAKEYRHVCYKEPVLVPLVKKVSCFVTKSNEHLFLY